MLIMRQSQLIDMIKFSAYISALFFSIAGCSYIPDMNIPVPNFNAASIMGGNATEEEKAWTLLATFSDVRKVTEDEYVIEAWGRPMTDMEVVERRLLARAGAETVREGYTHFAFIHLRDRNLPIAGGIYSDSIFGADKQWIGTYDELVRSRYERDFSAAPRNWAGPGLTAVMIPLNEGDPRWEKSFHAQSLYENLKARDNLK